MATDLGVYRRLARSMRRDYDRAFASANIDPIEILVLQKTAERLDFELRYLPHLVMSYSASAQPGKWDAGPVMWVSETQSRIEKEIDIRRRAPAAYIAKAEGLVRFWAEIRRRKLEPKFLHDKSRGIHYLIGPNKQSDVILKYIGSELSHWFDLNVNVDKSLISQGYPYAILRMFENRKDLVAALRLAQQFPPDVEKHYAQIDRPAWVEATSTVIGFIPVIGNAVAAYEAYSGKDIFNYRLTEVERGIMAAGVLLPFAARFVKAGKRMYSASRMKRLYGDDAASWSTVLHRSEGLHLDRDALRQLRLLQQTAQKGGRVAPDLGAKLNGLMRRIKEDPLSSQAHVVSPLARESLEVMSRKYKFLDDIDDLAMERLTKKGAVSSHIKGQLLEELLESKVAQWLSKPFGKELLGLSHVKERISFIPGHLIRDADGRQLSDGILGYLDKDDVFQMVGIFEAKAGQVASRGLTHKSTSLSKMSKADRYELRMVARETHEELQEQALEKGLPFNLTVENVEKKIIKTEWGGQIRQDVERLSGNASGALTDIYIGSIRQTVSMSAGRTKFFGVMPKDIKNVDKMKKQLTDWGYQFTELPIDITQRELNRFGGHLAKRITVAEAKAAKEVAEGG